VEAAPADVRFEDSAVFRGQSLSAQLDRVERVARITVSEAVTPLTRIVFGLDVERDRFESNETRNTNSYRVVGGVEFEPVALVSGRATVGYRKLKFLDDSIEGSRGVVAAVNIGYTMFPLTRIGINARRDAQYSYDVERPYYIQTGGTLVLTQGILDAWDVQLTGGRQNLGYADRFGRRGAGADTDRVTQLGVGLGYRFGNDMRVGLSFMNNRRTSPEPTRRYEGNQIGVSVTYGT
jgi:hypothetical protein